MIYERNERGLTRAIGYEVRGDGPAVLLLHPFPFDRAYWRGTIDALAAAGYRALAMDFRGYGDSALGEPGYGVDDLADDAVALLDHLGIAMAAVVGCSMGGYVALALADRHAARLSALVLADTRAAADSEVARANRTAAIAEIRAHGPDGYLDGVAVRACSPATPEAVRARVQALVRGAARDFPRALPAMLTALRDRPDRSALLPRLRLDVLILVGLDDPVTPPDEARAMHRAIPGARLVEIPRCGHLSSLEAEDAFNDALHAFLADAL